MFSWFLSQGGMDGILYYLQMPLKSRKPGFSGLFAYGVYKISTANDFIQLQFPFPSQYNTKLCYSSFKIKECSWILIHKNACLELMFYSCDVGRGGHAYVISEACIPCFYDRSLLMSFACYPYCPLPCPLCTVALLRCVQTMYLQSPIFFLSAYWTGSNQGTVAET